MPSGHYIFSQVMAHLPMKPFRRCVQRYHGNRYVKSFTCLDQFLCMAFAQLTYPRACVISKSACAHTGTNSIIWGYAAACHATPSPMPTRSATGASTPTLPTP